jgi:hypothetical protein
MAGGRLVVMTNSVSPIKGDCIADGVWKDQIKLSMLNFNASANVTLDDKAEWQGHVQQTEVTVALDTTGPWVCELQSALFSGQRLGNVTITEISQSNNAYKKVREIVLADAWITQISVGVAGTICSLSLRLAYETCTVNWADKVAFFHPEGKYK